MQIFEIVWSLNLPRILFRFQKSTVIRRTRPKIASTTNDIITTVLKDILEPGGTVSMETVVVSPTRGPGGIGIVGPLSTLPPCPGSRHVGGPQLSLQ